MKIFIVDDEEFILNFSVRILKDLGCDKVITAENGKFAIERLINTREPVDIIICDLKMPEMDGFEFMQYLASNHYTCGLIFLSGKGDYMQKPHMILPGRKTLIF